LATVATVLAPVNPILMCTLLTHWNQQT
jgi:hypothetical protein